MKLFVTDSDLKRNWKINSKQTVMSKNKALLRLYTVFCVITALFRLWFFSKLPENKACDNDMRLIRPQSKERSAVNLLRGIFNDTGVLFSGFLIKTFVVETLWCNSNKYP